MAVGVTSIVIAALQALVAAIGILSTVLMWRVAASNAAAAAPAVVAPAAVAPAAVAPAAAAPAVVATTAATTEAVPFAHEDPAEPSADAVAADEHRALERPQRAAVVAAVKARLPLSAARADVLDAMLRQVGKDIGPAAESVTSADQAAPLITDAARSPEGEDVITFTTGRLTLADDRASFEPAGTVQLVERSFAGQSPAPGEAGFDPGAPATAAQAQQAAATAAQRAATQAQVNAMMASMSPSAAPVATTIGLTMRAAAIALSVLLLVAAIKTLRGRRSGRSLHLKWAWLKIVVETISAVTAGVLTYTMMNAMLAANANAGVAVMPSWMAILSGTFSAALQIAFSLIYPVVVLIVMTRENVKRHFQTLN
jgi:hypothetical protein